MLLWAGSCVLCLALAADPPPTLPTQPLDPAHPTDLAPLLAPLCERRGVPGIVGAIVEGRHLVAIGAVGVRKAGGAEKVTIHDRFHIGSCTKAMTATLAAMLVESGKIAWKSTLAEIFPDLLEEMKPEYRPITLEQLLAHRSGFPRDIPYVDPKRKLPVTPAELLVERRYFVRQMLDTRLESTPGAKFLYSNAGYIVAAAMLERVGGRSWEQLLAERVFWPLGMKSAGFGAPGLPSEVREPRGHAGDLKPVEPGPGADNPPLLGPAGRVHCTIGDWAKFAALHLCGEQGDTRLLKPESFVKLHRPFEPDPEGKRYALGWTVTERRWGGGAVWTHTGSNTRWFAVLWLAPRRNFAVLAACNRGDTHGALACDDACWWLVNYFLSQRQGAAPQ